jgi:hypothetical protein
MLGGRQAAGTPAARDGRVCAAATGPAARAVALMEAWLAALRGRAGQPDAAPVYRPVTPALWWVPDALARVRAVLAAHPDGGTLQRFLPPLGWNHPDANSRHAPPWRAPWSRAWSSPRTGRPTSHRLRPSDRFT